MPRLTAISVKNAAVGRHVDGQGLCLVVKPTGARSWVLRVQVAGRRRDIGLGSTSELTLAEAREKAAALRKAAKAGRDPVLERDAAKRFPPTFREAALACHADLRGGWIDKNAAAFLASLKTHAFPALGNIRVDQIEAWHIRDMLMPIWLEIPVMARAVRQRVSMVLNFAKAKGWRTAEAPGRSVTLGLPRQPQARNFKAMAYKEVPAFVADLLAKPQTVGRFALLFVIFTAARSGEVRKARWSHLDLDKHLWHRPADLMKSKVAHTLTLNAGALEVLEKLVPFRTSADDLIFPGNGGRSISDMTITKVMRDARQAFAVHGFRSSFRDWAAEQMPSVPEAVAEAALAHAVQDKVERAYKRTTFVEMRRDLLDAWGRYLEGEDNIVRLAASG